MLKFVLVLKRMTAQAERKVHDAQGVLGVADSYAEKVKPGRSAQVSPAVLWPEWKLGGAGSAEHLLSLLTSPVSLSCQLLS